MINVKVTPYRTIRTKFHGPTNTRGSRISATSNGDNRIYLPWDHRLNADENHIEAAKALAAKMEWGGDWIGGNDGNGYLFVCPEIKKS